MGLDAIVVLGCRVVDADLLTSAAERRVLHAARVYAEGMAPRVVTSGGKLWNGFPEAEAFARALARSGVPRDAILCELWSESTAENARYVAALARREGFSTLGIVTCDWHMPRALAAFGRHGLPVTALSVKTPARTLPLRVTRYLKERACQLHDGISARVEGRG